MEEMSKLDLVQKSYEKIPEILKNSEIETIEDLDRLNEAIEEVSNEIDEIIDNCENDEMDEIKENVEEIYSRVYSICEEAHNQLNNKKSLDFELIKDEIQETTDLYF